MNAIIKRLRANPAAPANPHPVPGQPSTYLRRSITMRQRAVYHLLKHMGPSTDADLVRTYNRGIKLLDRGARYPQQSPSGIRTRRHELTEGTNPYVVDTGDRVALPSGRKAIIWKAV